jgi:RimJ/RimL family protein N-acetyltransferase
VSQIKKIGNDQKWFLSINNQTIVDFFSINTGSQDIDRIQIGACAFTKFDGFVDCSIFIFPEYRRNGHAKEIIFELTSAITNIRFTVSAYNRSSLNLFNTLSFLEVCRKNETNNTFTFRKRINYVYS